MKKHLLTLADCSKKDILDYVKLAESMKKNPVRYRSSMKDKYLLTFFQMPSLRTKISFHVAAMELNGQYIDYHASESPWGAGKESTEDVANVFSRYVDVVMVRMHDHAELKKLARESSVPVINGLTTFAHPCQILSDLLTIKEKFKKLDKLKICYLGDANNNVTHSLMFACALLGLDMSIGCPTSKMYSPHKDIISKAKKLRKKGRLVITKDPKTAIKGADVVYTDSWMSYRVPPKEKTKRMKALKAYRVTDALMKLSSKKSIFMHCLPATRGHEVTASVIDGKKSVVFDQAENRLHMQKAILHKCFH